MDRDRMEQGVRAFLDGLELRDSDAELERTAERVARAWSDDLLSGYAVDPDEQMTWGRPPDDAGPVVVRGISIASVCVHHLLPFFGTAHVAYLPQRRLAGLSKIGRVVDALSRRLQTQERLTHGIVESLERTLEPRAVMVRLEAEHTCMSLRGVRKEGGRMITLAAAGEWNREGAARAEALGLLSA